jgi:hypothetical protein
MGAMSAAPRREKYPACGIGARRFIKESVGHHRATLSDVSSYAGGILSIVQCRWVAPSGNVDDFEAPGIAREMAADRPTARHGLGMEVNGIWARRLTSRHGWKLTALTRAESGVSPTDLRDASLFRLSP